MIKVKYIVKIFIIHYTVNIIDGNNAKTLASTSCRDLFHVGFFATGSNFMFYS